MRNRLKITKPDETGFSKSVSVSKRPPLPTLDEDALDALRIKPAEPVNTDSVATEPAAAPPPARPEEVQTAPEPILTADPTPKKSPSKPEPSSTRGKSQTPRTTEDEKVELVLPPRARRANDNMTVHLRLRVLERHVAGLRALEDRGYHRRSVLQAALNKMPRLNLEPRYVPQLQEASAGAEWSHRWGPSVSITLLNQIAKQVRGGEDAPRAALIMGQIEPKWFASLDATIKKLQDSL